MVTWINEKLDQCTSPDEDTKIDNYMREEAERVGKQFRVWEEWAKQEEAEHGIKPKFRLLDLLRDDTLSIELEQAEHGNIEPLRNRFPQLAKYLHLPKRPSRGKRWPKFKDKYADDPVMMAIEDAKSIRALWKMAYDGKSNRKPDDGWSALQIAAMRRRVTVDEIKIE